MENCLLVQLAVLLFAQTQTHAAYIKRKYANAFKIQITAATHTCRKMRGESLFHAADEEVLCHVCLCVFYGIHNACREKFVRLEIHRVLRGGVRVRALETACCFRTGKRQCKMIQQANRVC